MTAYIKQHTLHGAESTSTHIIISFYNVIVESCVCYLYFIIYIVHIAPLFSKYKNNKVE